MRFALQIMNIEDAEPEPVWIDTTPRNSKEELDNAVTEVNELEVPKRIALRKLGFTDKEIDLMREMRAKEDVIPVEAQ